MATRSFTLARVARLLLCLSIVLSLFVGLRPAGARAAAQESGPSTVYFPMTGHHVADPFLTTWRRLGGLETFGYPLTEAFEEDGMLVQYFERERFELHPEQAGTEYEVQFALLGSWLAEGRTDPAFTPFPSTTPQPGVPNSTFYPETGHYLSNGFKRYWEQNGGLRIFGYPISEEFSENGLIVQYFERARFEWHPENAGTPHEILLGRLGADRAAFRSHDMSAVARQEGVPDYSESLWTPPPSEPRSIDLPILIYHRFGDYPERYQVTFTEFERQLDWLQANGYTTVTMSEVYDYIAGSGSLPARPVVLTFDDGWALQWRAAQAMTARGMRGVFFVTTRQNGLDVATLASWGHEIGGHTISHPDLTTLSDWQLAQELSVSRQQLQAWSGQSVDILAYPYGAYDGRVVAAAQAAGYRGAVAAWGGTYLTPDKWWFEPRVEVSGFHSLADFAAIVS